MPTTSSYYSDLEYPTVNEDGTTYGGIINTYINELLAKLYAVSQRVTTAQSQLNSINQGVNAVDIINTTLAGAIGSNSLLTGTGTTLLPDPYSGTYTKTTTWPAYASSFSGYGGGAIAVPTTVSEINSFDFEGYKNVLLAELARIEAVVDQAEADILTAQQDTCRTKKIIDAYNAGTTTKVWTTNNTIRVGFTMTNAVSGSAGTSASFQFGVASGYGSQFTSLLTAGYATDQATTTYWNWRGGGPTYTPPVNNYNVGDTVLGVYIDFLVHGNITMSYDSQGLVNGAFNGSWFGNQSFSQGSGFLVDFTTLKLEEQTVYPSPDFSSCTSPSPPYFIS